MLPDPLHPAIVHFPIVLLLLGAPLAVIAVVFRSWHLPVLAAVVLAMGAAGAVMATVTGEQGEEMAGELHGNGEKVLDEHEDWGKRARNFGVAAGILAILSAALCRKPVAGRLVATAAALAAIAAALCVAQAGHHGGRLVYKYGVGVNTAAGAAETSSVSLKPETGQREKADRED